MSPVDFTSEPRALRFLTAGSVDDGKSTLIGRLLYDSRAIPSDQLDGLERRAGSGVLDLSLLTDGLEAEREQGITIDVAYRYFATEARKFVIADAPGHEEYTRNMVTAAAGSDAAVVLIDVTKIDWRRGAPALLPQTRRHSIIAQLLRVPNIVFAVNKLDAVGPDAAAAYGAVTAALEDFSTRARLSPTRILPISALRGDNVSAPSSEWSWYRGPTLLELLHALPAAAERVDGPLRLPVQYLTREGDGAGQQRRVVWGRIARGAVHEGDAVEVFPGGQVATVAEVRHAGTRTVRCEAGESAGLVLDRQVDVSRGDWIASPAGAGDPITGALHFGATLAWLDTEPSVLGRKYWVRHGHRWAQARITSIGGRLDLDTLEQSDASALEVNDIGRVGLEVQIPLPVAPYSADRVAGALILVDPATNRTCAAALVNDAPGSG